MRCGALLSVLWCVRGCVSLKLCVLLDKKERRTVEVPLDYTGFICPD